MKCVSKKCPFKDVNPDNCHFFDGCDFAVDEPTNADRIRAMSDEELASILGDKCICPDTGNCTRHYGDCIACWLEWLQQPAEEG